MTFENVEDVCIERSAQQVKKERQVTSVDRLVPLVLAICADDRGTWPQILPSM
jgi:hypothetical protein